MSDRAVKIRQLLTEKLNATSIQVEDESWEHSGHAGAKESGGGHFSVHIVADCFTGLNHIQRHRLVYKALNNEFGPTIHALSIKAIAPGES